LPGDRFPGQWFPCLQLDLGLGSALQPLSGPILRQLGRGCFAEGRIEDLPRPPELHQHDAAARLSMN